MRFSTKAYMGRTYTIDPASLSDGDKVYVHVCDTSATAVWGYDAVATRDDKGRLILTPYGDSGWETLPLDRIDGCYTYLTAR